MKPSPQAPTPSFLSRHHWLVVLLFTLLTIVVVLWQTAIRMPEYLIETSRLTPFYTSEVFLTDMLCRPAGLLSVCSGFVAQLCQVPWLGAVVLALLTAAVGLVSIRAFRLPAWWSGVAFVAPLMLLAAFTQLGYMLYVLKAVAPGITPLAGTLLALLLFWAYRVIVGYLRVLHYGWPLIITSSVLGVIVVAGFYPLIGFFALLAAALIAVYEFAKAFVHRRWPQLAVVVCVALSAAFAPQIWFTHRFVTLPTDYIYTCGLPDFRLEGDETALLWPLVVAFALLMSGAALAHKAGWNRRRLLVPLVLSSVVFGGAVFAAHQLAWSDPNYRCILRMSQATDRGDWQAVVAAASESDTEPTRAEVMLRNLALQKQGRAADVMFSFPDGDADYRAPRHAPYLRLICAHQLYYYYGKVNYSYRWAMEDMVEYGMRPVLVDYLTRCALVNEEPLLAGKYHDLLRSRMFWSRDIADYNPCDSTSAMPLMSLRNYNNLLDGDGGLIEPYILNSFAFTYGGSREMTHLSLQSALVLKDIDHFWPPFLRLLPTFGTAIPRHYQEAVLLFSALQPRYDISELPIDADIRSQFERLVAESTQNSSRGDDVNAAMLRPAFGHTYWYYYFFVKGLKTH